MRIVKCGPAIGDKVQGRTMQRLNPKSACDTSSNNPGLHLITQMLICVSNIVESLSCPSPPANRRLQVRRSTRSFGKLISCALYSENNIPTGLNKKYQNTPGL